MINIIFKLIPVLVSTSSVGSKMKYLYVYDGGIYQNGGLGDLRLFKPLPWYSPHNKGLWTPTSRGVRIQNTV